MARIPARKDKAWWVMDFNRGEPRIGLFVRAYTPGRRPRPVHKNEGPINAIEACRAGGGESSAEILKQEKLVVRS
ncbi:hypothetical protein ACUN0C_09025 [Faunimonas sp. B44]